MAYVPAFSSGRWFSCTLSFSGMVNFEGFSGIGPSLYWDTCNHAVNALLDRRCVHGAYWAEELSLRALCPELLVLPHAHAVFHRADDIARPDDICGFLEEQMATFLNNELLRDRGLRKIARFLRLPPSVQVNPLATQRDLFFATGYVTKTIKLVQLYRDTRVMLGRREQWQANAQLEQFFAAWDCEMWQETRTGKPRTRRQIFRRGTLRSQSNSYVGLRKTDWWPQQERKRLRLLFARLMRQPSSWNPAGDDPFGIDAELESQETPISLLGSEEES